MEVWLKTLCLLLFLQLLEAVPQSGKKKANTINDEMLDMKNLMKECNAISECMSCNFEELKTEKECQQTGFYIMKECNYYDESNTKTVSETHEKEKCDGSNIQFIAVYLSIFAAIGIISQILRKKQKQKIFGNVFDRLKSVKYK